MCHNYLFSTSIIEVLNYLLLPNSCRMFLPTLYLKRSSILKEGKKRIKNFISRLENRDVNND